MLEETIRPLYQRLFVEPIVQRLGDNVAPLHITLLAAGCGILFIPAILFLNPFVAIGLLLMSGYCDTLDGSLARFQNKSTPLGSVIDIIVDRLVEFCAIFGLYLINPATRALTTILMLGSMLLCITSFLVVGIFMRNESQKSFHYSPGLMERAEAFCFFIVMVLVPQHFNFFAGIFTGLVLLTACIRLWQFAKIENQEIIHTRFSG